MTKSEYIKLIERQRESGYTSLTLEERTSIKKYRRDNDDWENHWKEYYNVKHKVIEEDKHVYKDCDLSVFDTGPYNGVGFNEEKDFFAMIDVKIGDWDCQTKFTDYDDFMNFVETIQEMYEDE